MLSRGFTPTMRLLKLRGSHTLETEPTLVMAEVHGSFSSGEDSESLLKCRHLLICVHQHHAQRLT